MSRLARAVRRWHWLMVKEMVLLGWWPRGMVMWRSGSSRKRVAMGCQSMTRRSWSGCSCIFDWMTKFRRSFIRLLRSCWLGSGIFEQSVDRSVIRKVDLLHISGLHRLAPRAWWRPELRFLAPISRFSLVCIDFPFSLNRDVGLLAFGVLSSSQSCVIRFFWVDLDVSAIHAIAARTPGITRSRKEVVGHG